MRPSGPRIGPWQLAFLVVMLLTIQGSTGANRLLTPLAGRDLWISLLAAVPLGLIGLAILLALAARHPRLDLAGILRHRLGAVGYLAGLLYVLLFLAQASSAAAEFGGFSRQIFRATPQLALLLPLVGLALYGCLLGVEVLARVNAGNLIFVNIPLGIGLFILSAHQQSLARALPILANGWHGVLAGAQLATGQYAQLVLVLVLLPLTSQGRRARRALAWAVVLVAFIDLGHNMGPVLVFGGAVERLRFPTYEMIRVIEAGRFVERLDLVAIWLWMTGFWIEMTLMLYVAAATAAGVFGLRSARGLMPPLAAAILAGAALIPNQETSTAVRWFVDADAFPALGFGLPLLLLAWSLIQDRFARARRGQGREDDRPGAGSAAPAGCGPALLPPWPASGAEVAEPALAMAAAPESPPPEGRSTR